MLRPLLHIFIGIPAMVGVYYACRWLAIGISFDFGLGVGVGMMLAAGLMYAVERVDPEAFYGRRDRRLEEHYGD